MASTQTSRQVKSSNLFWSSINSGTKGDLKAVDKEQIIEWMREQFYLRLLDLQKYFKKQYDVVFDRLQSYHNFSKKRE